MMGAGIAIAFELDCKGMHSLQQLVRVRFPSVPQISTAGLAAWLSDEKRSRPLLLDIREREEFDVSHLAGAIAIAPKARPEVVAILAGKKTPIVLYCSVGYRSSAFALRLINAGFADVQNLEGSIFQWANEGRPLEAGGKPVSRVHPYHRWFRRLLKEGVSG